MKNEKKITYFAGIKRDIMGEWEEICFAAHFLCLQSKSFLEPFYFFIGFVIPKEEFGKDKLHGGIKFIFQTWIQKIWFICKLFCFRWNSGHVTNPEDMLQTHE